MVVFIMIVIVIVHCRNMQLQGLLSPHKLFFKKVVVKTIDAIYYCLVKNGWD